VPRKVFVAGEILTAADVNTNLMDQAVMVFDDSSARGSAIPTPSEGMVTYLKDTDLVEVYDGSAFQAVSQPGILQVVSATHSTEVTVASTTYADTGLTATITPSAASSKVLVLVSQQLIAQVNATTDISGRLKIVRDSTDVETFARFAYHRATAAVLQGGGNLFAQVLDSPNTTSAVTYKTQASSDKTSDSGRAIAQSNNTISTITLLEVAG
jgi:hypothetical protein